MQKEHFLSVLPKYKSVVVKINWTIFYDELFENLLLNLSDHSIQKLNDLCFNLGNYRCSIVLNGVSFLAAIFSNEKTIRLATPHLGQELFILESIRKEHECEFKEESDFIFFRNYVKSIASLDSRTFPTRLEILTHKEKLPHLLDKQNLYTKVNPDISRKVDLLLIHVNKYKSSFLEKITDRALEMTANYALLRIHLLKFLAILPSLDHDLTGVEVKRILIESYRRLISDSKIAKNKKLTGQMKPLPILMINILKYSCFIFQLCPAKPLSFVIRFKVRFMAKRFIAGTTIIDAEVSLKKLIRTNRDVTLDQLGELVVSELEADLYQDKVIELITGFSLHIPKGEKNVVGINKAHVSIKISALCSDFRPEAFEQTYALVAPRLRKILLAAKEHQVFLNIDAEHYHFRDIVLDIYSKLLLDTKDLYDFDQTGIVIQAYLIDANLHFEKILELAKKRNLKMPVRIVKGAYWDAETIEAKAHSFESFQFLNKEESDLHFRQLLIKVLESSPHLQLCIASHNYVDHCFSEVVREKYFSSALGIEHQCLHMTYEALSFGLSQMGWATRNYVPVGSLLVGMAYLVRRIMENSSQVGVLTIMRSHKSKAQMIPPEQVHLDKIKKETIIRDWGERLISSKFFNVKPLRLYVEDERDQFKSDFSVFKELILGKTYSNIFEEKYCDNHIQKVYSSSQEDLLVGTVAFFNEKNVDDIVDTLNTSFLTHDWCKKKNWIIRSMAILKLANLLHLYRNELSALIVFEAGKAVNEALADVDEAIDFCSFYAKEEARLQLENKYISGRGVTAVIPPWNFPLAIPCGMVVASLVAGNPTILKSAEQTPLIATRLAELIFQAGIPKEIFIHLPGVGTSVGQRLVDNKKISTYAFTGSKAVGMMIYKNAGKRLYQNLVDRKKYPVKVIAEMGGKNAIIVTKSAELDETVAAILYSAFGHSGQKCSACSRVLVNVAVKDRLVERLTQAINDLKVGAAYDMGSFLNPIISKEDKNRLQTQVKEAVDEIKVHGGVVHVDRSNENLVGHGVGPVLIEIDKARSYNKESFAQTELFGPVLHLVTFDHLSEAVKQVNSINYALTAGIFSQSQDDIDFLSAKIKAGNIYINRPITGARVAIEPFGGFKLSGTGPKAGGRNYLSAFHLIKNEIEKIEHTTLIENGSDTDFQLCEFDQILLEVKHIKIDLALRRILNLFEVYFEISGKKKKCLSRFKKWLLDHSQIFFKDKIVNRSIPGQDSYSDHQITTQKTLFISTFEKPSFTQFMNFLAALTSCSSVTVCALNFASYDWWQKMINVFHESGLSKVGLNVYFTNSKHLNELIMTSNLENIIIDGDTQYIESLSCTIAESINDSQHLKKILTWIDAKDLNNYEQLLSPFVYERSYAVNTMRHGAPLQLEF